MRSSTNSMSTKALLWGTNFCPEHTIFTNKRARKCPRSRVIWITKSAKQKTNGVKLLPDEEAVDCHLRVLFWLGLKESVKDKARHKKDSCKTFTDLIAMVYCGEKE